MAALNFTFEPEVEAFRQEVRDFIAENLNAEVLSDAELGLAFGPKSRGFVRKMGERGWLSLTWPERFGGRNLSAIYNYVLVEELNYGGAPGPGNAGAVVAPTLIRRGTPWQQEVFLPKIRTGEIEFALGFSEPEAGSDLAALQLRAVPHGDHFVLGGQKRFTSTAHCSQYIWLAARTDPNLPRHKGVSLIIVPIDLPGITVVPLWTIADGRTNEVFFDNVRVPREYLVGELNQGFAYIAEGLADERYALIPVGQTLRQFEALVDWVRGARRDGRPLAQDPRVRQAIARLACEIEVARLHKLRVLHQHTGGENANIASSMSKLSRTHTEQRLDSLALDLMGAAGQLCRGSPHVQADGWFEFEYRASVLMTIGGGSSEIQKDIIARRFLGLERQ